MSWYDNINYYLNNDERCNYDSLEKDIEESFNYSSPDGMLNKRQELMELYNEKIKSRTNDIMNAVNLRDKEIMDGKNIDYAWLSALTNYPFIASYNVVFESLIINHLFKKNIKTITDYIQFFVERFYIDNNLPLTKLPYSIKSNGNEITMDRLKKNLLFPLKNGYLDDKATIEDYKKEYQSADIDEKRKKQGNYGESIFYHEQLEMLDPNRYVIYWVARDIGNGFGYDLLIYDKIENTTSTYEIKAVKNLSHITIKETEYKYYLGRKEEELNGKNEQRKTTPHILVYTLDNDNVVDDLFEIELDGNMIKHYTNPIELPTLSKDLVRVVNSRRSIKYIVSDIDNSTKDLILNISK